MSLALGDARRLEPGGAFRYGVFLRPPVELADAPLRAYDVAKTQFGFSAANAYPPHITLVGSIALTVDEAALVSAVESVVVGTKPFVLHNPGVIHWGNAVAWTITDAAGHEGAMASLVGRILDAVAPLRVYPPLDRTTPNRLKDSPETFEPHLSIVGHDGHYNPGVLAELTEYLKALGLDGPAEVTGEWVSLYRFHSDDWTGRYWETMSWRLLKSWRLS